MRHVNLMQQKEMPAIVRLWILRILVVLGAQQKFIDRDSFYSDGLAQLIGLGKFLEENAFNRPGARTALARLHRQAEAHAADAQVPDVMRRNVARLAELVGLSPLDCRILELTVLLHIEPVLEETAEWLGYLSSVKVFRVLSGVLSTPESAIQEALMSLSTVSPQKCATGFMTKYRNWRCVSNGTLARFTQQHKNYQGYA